ncbi:MAG TPA: MupA/Atu3671 family FMN-dependent luciferase-like monooxygenase [Polyangiaceae bacterium]
MSVNPNNPTHSLTPVQQGMLFHFARDGQTGTDIEQMVLTASEPLVAADLQRAFSIVADCHAALRSRFHWEGIEEPFVETLPHVEVQVDEQDLSGLPAEERRAHFEDWLRRDRRAGIDLASPPLSRIVLVRLAADEQRLVWTFPHIILDGNSFARVVGEWLDAYEDLRAGRTPRLTAPRPYADHVTWLQTEILSREAAARTYFSERLSGFESKNELIETRLPNLRGEQGPTLFGAVSTSLTRELTDRLRAEAARLDITLNTFVQAAWALVLADFTGQNRVVFGVVRGCRGTALPEARDMVGLFINTLPLHVSIDGAKQTDDYLRTLRENYRSLREYEHTPLPAIAQYTGFSHAGGMFDSAIVFNEQRVGSALGKRGGLGSRVSVEFLEQTNFALTLFAYAEPELELLLSYDPGRVSDNRAAALVQRLEAALASLANAGAATLSALARVPERELELLSRWNDTAAPPPSVETIHAQFEDQVARTPDATALTFRDQSLTYRDLNRRANRVARRLRELGVARESLVAIHAPRSLEMVIGMLGILKAGAAYVPLDPHYPAERIAMMLEDAKPKAILTLGVRPGSLTRGTAELVDLDALSDLTPADAFSSELVGGGALAYVIFTSGSTGRPKGVMVEHRNVLNFFAGMDRHLGTEPGVWLAVTSISFDISVLELFWTLTRGFHVVLQQEGDKASLGADASAGDVNMQLSLFYFASDASSGPVASNGDAYRLLIEGARFADAHGFTAVWTPERHFHAFGGLYPNAAITSAAIATVTKRIQLRAGSVVLPLHNPIRVAEDWALVDNLSHGRVGLSFASGWHANDFALMPDSYEPRRTVMLEHIETVKKLWRGERISVKSGSGEMIEISTLPRPVQAEPPIWLTAAGNVATFEAAGKLGANILTNMLGQSVDDLKTKLAAYRNARRSAGFAGPGHVTLMLHTFVGTDVEEVKRLVRRPFIEYLRTSTDLVKRAKWYFPAFARPGSSAPDGSEVSDVLSPADEQALLDHAFERYFETHGLFGTPESCYPKLAKLGQIGVDEIACLVDFGVETETVLASLSHLARLLELTKRSMTPYAADDFGEIAAQVTRHRVTHLQCTPSLAQMLLEDPSSNAVFAALRAVLLGGEPLPPALADRVLSLLENGRLLNMYGPTETTVWSSVAIVKHGEPITIGTPIVNTSIYVLGATGALAPPGVAGELCIGGSGVVRGYLERPELTRQRFLPDPFGLPRGAAADRYYRTGDRARYRDDGQLEFLGRLDQQVKLRGYRIELGEVEAALAKHDRVAECVVVAREDVPGDQRLVAYVVPRPERVGADSETLAAWQQLWNGAYADSERAGGVPVDPTFDTSGWVSSYTGGLIEEAEMREWVDHTVERIRDLGGSRIMEIGCGTGLLLFRLAPEADRFVGVDFAATGLEQIRKVLAERSLPQVELLHAAANALPEDLGLFDVVVLNSVVQYFPDLDYLLRVLAEVSKHLAPGGALFIGDVRSRQLCELQHASIELATAPGRSSAHDVMNAIRRRVKQDGELLLEPRFFAAAAAQVGLEVESVRLKRGRAENELVKFRYDVSLRRAPVAQSDQHPALVEKSVGVTLEALRAWLAERPEALRVHGIENARVSRERAFLRLLEAAPTDSPLDAVRSDPTLEGIPGIHPEDLFALSPQYEVDLRESPGEPGWLEATFVRRDLGGLRALARPNSELLPAITTLVQANQRGANGELDVMLKQFLASSLPDFMVPSSIVTLERLPLTPNGKLDRKALPAPSKARSLPQQTFKAPQSDLEQRIAGVFEALLGVTPISVTDNFFDLGANSLLVMQATARLRTLLERTVPLVDLYQHPTVATLAEHLAATSGGASDPTQPTDAATAGQARARARAQALNQRRRPKPA